MACILNYGAISGDYTVRSLASICHGTYSVFRSILMLDQ
jgi:hypothetical protein